MKLIATLSLAGFAVATSAVAQPRPGDAAPAVALTGAQVYENVCQACHMPNAKGAVGAGRIASLAGNANLKYPEYPIGVVTGGKGAMPWFRGQLTDQQIADVITYVRTHFGNNYKAKVTVAQVADGGVPAPHEYER
ncbi:c-type cytochrome [Polymorphobacter sp. PAMC 29334]|uniref:c-type cytochrome n=1 Tax=Polymorphobacter sp. PAMC 29334 TaxID=2862331 RepID=UPI001C73E173|nr:c-type cytochrome [Polymorphobacter sp. PAMC 29334]QYE36357.1 c-type cytochrome [Polymorphobacter sp. PAMC 29334]